MPTLAKKKEFVEEIKNTLENSSAIYIVNYEGMTVADLNEICRRFYNAGVNYRVFKNTLIKRAMDEYGGYEDLYPYLNEMNGFAFVDEDLGQPAKVIKQFAEEYKKPHFKAALVDGDFYGEDSLETLASMKSKEEVIGDIIGLLQSPMSNVVSGLQAQGSNIAGAIKEISEKSEE